MWFWGLTEQEKEEKRWQQKRWIENGIFSLQRVYNRHDKSAKFYQQFTDEVSKSRYSKAIKHKARIAKEIHARWDLFEKIR